MAQEYVNIGDAIEGAKVEIYTRKETWKAPRLDPMTRKMMMVCELERNCSAEVTAVLPLSKADLKTREEYAHIHNVVLHGEVGDKLKASAITVYTDTKRRLPVEVKEGQTATHGGHLISCPRRTFALIKYPFVAITAKFLPTQDTKEQIENKTATEEL